MDLIQQNYPKNVHLQVATFPLTQEDKDNLYKEFHGMLFLQSDLQSLLSQSSYYKIRNEVFTLNVIPHPKITPFKIKKIMRRLMTLQKIFKLATPMVIWLVPTHQKRYFPKKGALIDLYHINGGYTYPSTHTIYIYRYEEYPKVLLHEILHHSYLRTKWSKETLSKLYNVLHIHPNTDIRPEEAIIEVWAMYYHVLFVAYEKHLNEKDLLLEELQWSLSQTKRLLDYHRQYFPNGWQEHTAGYSYIYLKTCLLFYWTAFTKLEIPYTDQKLVDFILTHINKKSFQNAILKSPVLNTKSFQMTRFGNL